MFNYPYYIIPDSIKGTNDVGSDHVWQSAEWHGHAEW